MSAKHFGDILKQLRNDASLTQTELAKKVGTGRSFIAKLEAGLHIPGWDVVQKLARVLGVSCEAFNEAPPAAEPTKPAAKKRNQK